MPFLQDSTIFRIDQDGAGGGEGDSQVKVQALSDGSFVFVWRELEDNQPDHYRIFVRKFTPGLLPTSDQIKVDGVFADVAGNGFSTPSIAASNDGRFFVEYDDYGGSTLYRDGGFYADRVWPWLIGFEGNQPFGQIPLLGLPDRDDPAQSASVSSSAIAPNGTGGWHSVVVQDFINNPEARTLLVNGQKVDVGLSPGGHFIQVNADIADAGESAFVAWNRGVSNSDSDVYAMIVGQPMFRVNSQTQGYQMLSPGADAIAVLGTGIFVVTWSDLSTQDEATDPGEGVRARIFAPDGSPITGEIMLRLNPAGNETRPMVAALENNYWVAVWVDERGTVAQLFSELGYRTGEEQVLIPDYSGFSSITVLPGNELVIAWQERSDTATDRTLAQKWQVTFSNNAPYARPDGTYDAKVGESLAIIAAHGLLANDFDPDGNALNASVNDGRTVHGNVVVNPDGSFHYTPDPGFSGIDAFAYQVADGTGFVSGSTVRIEVRQEVQMLDKKVIVDILNRFMIFIGSPERFDESVFEGEVGEIMLDILGVFIVIAAIVLDIGSLEMNIDTDGDGSFETLITLEDPIGNQTVLVEQLADRSRISFEALAAATAGNDIIAGTAGLDYIGGDAGNDRLSGLAGNDALTGGDGNDVLLPGSGTDSVKGDAGDDGIYFGAALDATDKADGGDGVDTLAIQGAYASLDLAGVSHVEVLALLPGSDTRFGDISGDYYGYVVKSADANVAAGARMTVSATGLRPGEDLSFDGSAESDGHFRIFAGRGEDALVGGAGNDGFFFGAEGNLTAADRVDGGGGIDSLALRGNYVGAGAVVFEDASFANIEILALLSGHSNEYSGVIVAGGYDYDVTLADGNLAAGRAMDVNANRLGADESLRFDGRLETNGSFRILSGAGDDELAGGALGDILYGGLGADAIDGGGGSDIYVYRSTAESTAGAADILAFVAGDRIDLSFIDGDGAGNADAFAFIGAAAFSGTAGELRAFQSGANAWTVEGDTNGDGAADLTIIVGAAAPLAAADFVL